MSSARAPGVQERTEIHDDAEFGEWLREQILKSVPEDHDTVQNRVVEAVQDRLNQVREPLPPLQVVILFETEMTAFIGPGRYIYITRGFLHHAAWEDAIAMAVAHEMAHHDLGHTRFFAEQQHWLRSLPGSVLFHLFRKVGQRWLNGPEQEAAADELGLELCLKAGFNGRSCTDLFDVLQTYALDCGDLRTALGEEDLNSLLPGKAGRWLKAGRTWLRERSNGYHSLWERKKALRRLLASQRTPGHYG